MTDPQPAQDLQAERSILGSILLNPNVLGDLKGLKPEHFYRPTHECIFSVLLRMCNDGIAIDAEILLNELEREGKLVRVGGAPYLHTLLEAPSVAANARYYAHIVIQKWKQRQLDELGQRFVQLGRDSTAVEDIPEALEAARRFLDEVDVDNDAGDDFDSAYRGWMDWYQTDTVVIPTPWPGINNICMGGFHKGRVYTFTGRPGAGKSALGLNAILHAARCGYRSVTYSLEMPSSECLSRILAAGANVPLKNIFQHRLTAEESKRISDFADQPWRNLMKIDDSPSQTIHTIAADARARRNRDGLDLIAIDHSLLLDPADKNLSEIQHINSVARGAKLLARRLDCALLLLHQMNREREGQGRRRPQLKDLYGGGEKDADIIIALDRDEDHIIGYPLKNRMGPIKTAATLVDELAYGRLG